MTEYAFPCIHEIDGNWQKEPSEEHRGMSLRDYFAAKALPLAWAVEQEHPTGPYSDHMEPTYSGAAARAYYMADAMLEARKK